MVKRKDRDEVVEVQPDKALWDSDYVNMFCDLCIKEIESGNFEKGTFTSQGWRAISGGFKEQTGLVFTHKQFRNKWDGLKADYKLWSDLKKGFTSISWDPRRKTIAAPEEWWRERLQVLPKAKKFRSRGINPELESKLERMFGAIIVECSNARAPSSGVLPLNVIGHSEAHNLDHLELENDVSSNSKYETIHGSSTKLANSIEQLVNIFENRCTNGIFINRDLPGCSIPEVMAILDQMEEVQQGGQLYMFAVTQLFMVRENREMFVALSPNIRLQYLKEMAAKVARLHFD